MIDKARRQIEPRAHPTPRAWLASIEALAHASAHRQDRQARSTQALLTAERAIEHDRASVPPWPWVFPFDDAKLAGYRALVAVRLNQPSQALAAFAESAASAQPAPKQRAAVMLDVATAVRQGGELSHDTSQVGGVSPRKRRAQDRNRICIRTGHPASPALPPRVLRPDHTQGSPVRPTATIHPCLKEPPCHASPYPVTEACHRRPSS